MAGGDSTSRHLFDPYQPIASQCVMVTVTATAQAMAALLSTGTPSVTAAGNTKRIDLQVQAQTIRYTIDGTDPVATSHGFTAATGDVLALFGTECVNFKAIREGGTNATLAAQVYA